MPVPLSSAYLLQKNKITSNEAWILLMEYRYPGEVPIYLCLNNTQVIWGGVTWEPACFSVSEDKETKDGDLPSVPLSFIDLNRKITPILDKYGGGNGAAIWIRAINSGLITEAEPARKRQFQQVDANVNHYNQVTLYLGVPDLSRIRDPQDRYFKNYGRNSVKFKDSTCGYTGAETECDKTLARCRELGNSIRYCGFPGVGDTGFLA